MTVRYHSVHDFNHTYMNKAMLTQNNILNKITIMLGMDVSHSVYLYVAKVILSKQSLNFQDKTSFCQFLTWLLLV